MPASFEIDWTMEREEGRCAVCTLLGPGIVVGTRNADDGSALKIWRCLACDSATIHGGVGDREPTDGQISEYLTGAGGLDPIIANLYRVEHATVSSMLDVGCNLGFGVHYATAALGWHAVGVEPSRAGEWGARHLGIDVRRELLDDTSDLGEWFDLVVASEVLEHVPDADAFVRALASQLAPGGTVVLTTPDSDVLGPGDLDGSSQIVGMGEHRFLASREGLRGLLNRAGFESIAFSRSGVSHIVVAAREPGRRLSTVPTGPTTGELARYFVSVAGDAEDPALAFAMWGRAFVVAVAAGDWEVADAAEAEYVALAATLHSIDLAEPDAIVAAAGRGFFPAFLLRFAHAAGMSRLARGLESARSAAYLRACLAVADARRAQVGWLDAGSSMLRTDASRQLTVALVAVDPAAVTAHLDELEREDPDDVERWVVRAFVDAVARATLPRIPGLGDRAAAALGAVAEADPELFLRAVSVMAELAIVARDRWTAETWATLGLDHLREVLPPDAAARERLLGLRRRARALPARVAPIRSPQVVRAAESALWEHASTEVVEGEISVVIAMYNGRRFVERALASVAAQSVQPMEVIVVDDGSSDGSAELVASLTLDVPVIVVSRDNGGQSAARNTGIRRARGEFLAFLDQDDEWRADHLKVLRRALAAESDRGWVFSDFDGVDAEGRTIVRHFIAETKSPHPRNSLGALVVRDIMALPSASLLRRAALRETKGFDRRLIGYEDDDVFVRVFRAGWTYTHISKSTVRYRLHDEGASSTPAFLRSRLIFLDTLLRTMPSDGARGLHVSGVFLFPRFLGATVADYARALSARDYESAARSALVVREMLEMLGHLPARVRFGLRLMEHPRRMRALLAGIERMPRFIRRRVPGSLRLSAPNSMRAERANLLARSRR